MTRCREKVTTHKTRRETFGQIPPSQPPEGTNPADTFFFFFLAASGVCCCARAFSGCCEQGLLFVVASHCGGFSCCGAQALGAWASVVVARGLGSCDSRALERRLRSCGSRA